MITKKAQKAAEVLANQRAAFEKKVRSLLGHVAVVGSRENRVKSADLDKAFDALEYKGEYGPAAEAFAAEVASREPVGAAIHALKVEAVNHAELHARETVDRVAKELAEHGWDRQAYAPYPGTYDRERDRKLSHYQLVHSITKTDPSVGYRSRSSNEPDPAVMDMERIEKFVENSMRDAAMQYDMFICKMVAKVGPVVSAKLDGSHVWSISYLDVVKADGSTESWKTQQIVNYSKYGRPFYQWPSRKLGRN